MFSHCKKQSHTVGREIGFQCRDSARQNSLLSDYASPLTDPVEQPLVMKDLVSPDDRFSGFISLKNIQQEINDQEIPPR